MQCRELCRQPCDKAGQWTAGFSDSDFPSNSHEPPTSFTIHNSPCITDGSAALPTSVMTMSISGFSGLAPLMKNEREELYRGYKSENSKGVSLLFNQRSAVSGKNRQIANTVLYLHPWAPRPLRCRKLDKRPEKSREATRIDHIDPTSQRAAQHWLLSRTC